MDRYRIGRAICRILHYVAGIALTIAARLHARYAIGRDGTLASNWHAHELLHVAAVFASGDTDSCTLQDCPYKSTREGRLMDGIEATVRSKRSIARNGEG